MIIVVLISEKCSYVMNVNKDLTSHTREKHISLDCTKCKLNLQGEDTMDSHMKGTHNKKAKKQTKDLKGIVSP